MALTTSVRGTRGECLAVDFLLKKGYRVVKRNFRYGKGEIDIIAMNGDVLVFVEVKMRATARFGTPEEAITFRKQRQIRMAAEGYLALHGLTDQLCRCDVIAIRDQGDAAPLINHIENAF